MLETLNVFKLNMNAMSNLYGYLAHTTKQRPRTISQFYCATKYDNYFKLFVLTLLNIVLKYFVF